MPLRAFFVSLEVNDASAGLFLYYLEINDAPLRAFFVSLEFNDATAGCLDGNERCAIAGLVQMGNSDATATAGKWIHFHVVNAAGQLPFVACLETACIKKGRLDMRPRSRKEAEDVMCVD